MVQVKVPWVGRCTLQVGVKWGLIRVFRPTWLTVRIEPVCICTYVKCTWHMQGKPKRQGLVRMCYGRM